MDMGMSDLINVGNILEEPCNETLEPFFITVTFVLLLI